MRLLAPARAAMRSTRAPPRPWRANSAVAASRMLARVRSGSRPFFMTGPSFHPKELVDAARVFAEALVRLHVESARVRQVDLEVVGHARRARGQDDDARAEEDGL